MTDYKTSIQIRTKQARARIKQANYLRSVLEATFNKLAAWRVVVKLPEQQ